MPSSDHRLPNGLPATFTNGRVGFDRLQDLLGLANRHEWEAILNSREVKATLKSIQPKKRRRLRSSQRRILSALSFYGLPEKRRQCWKLHMDLDIFDLGTSLDEFVVPSLEYESLRRFDPSAFQMDFRPGAVAGALKGVTDRKFGRRCPGWQRPALIAWPDIREDLERWGELSTDRQLLVGIATFAVATVLDDVRFLAWAARRVKALAEDFAFALGPGFESGQEGQSEPTRAPDAVQSLPSTYVELLQEWNAACNSTADIAAELKADPPAPQRLEELLPHVRRLESLRDSLQEALQARNRAILVSDIAETVGGLGLRFDAPWLAGLKDQVHAQWKLAYLVSTEAPEEQVKGDVARLAQDLEQELRLWRKAEELKAERQRSLTDLERKNAGDLVSRLKSAALQARLHTRLAEAIAQASEQQGRILSAIAPRGAQFDLDKDYLKEWKESGASNPVPGPGSRSGPAGPPAEAARPV